MSNPAITYNTDLYGPLAVLPGTWVGDGGYNVMTVPHKGDHINNPIEAFSNPIASNGEPSVPLKKLNGTCNFLVMLNPITETQVFNPIGGGVPNRGADGKATNGAMKYVETVSEKTSSNLLHQESGLWVKQNLPEGYSGSPTGAAAEFDIFRQAAVPHGNSIMAPGTSVEAAPTKPGDKLESFGFYTPSGNSETAGGAQNTVDSFLPTFASSNTSTPPAGALEDLQEDYLTQMQAAILRLGAYAEQIPGQVNSWEDYVNEFMNPLALLQAHRDTAMMDTTGVSITVDTENGEGGVVNIPFGDTYAKPIRFVATFMLQSLQNYPGTYFPPADKSNPALTDPEQVAFAEFLGPHHEKPKDGTSQHYSLAQNSGVYTDQQAAYSQLQYLQYMPMWIPNGYSLSSSETYDIIVPHFNWNTLVKTVTG